MKTSRGKNIIISVSVPEDLTETLGDICSSDGIPRSRIVTQALEAYIRYKYPHMWKILEVHRSV